QTTAEQDMEIIRTKRATSTAVAAGSAMAGAGAGQPKSKYRKRASGQRATPPGKCHSCNIRETPEWRRGPDGARTLCNACGLHYAKLMRKREKQIATEGKAPRIDMETLRASARAAEHDKANSSR
ncbi:GATA-domain-containing protein, partial [Athelia psychrophila]